MLDTITRRERDALVALLIALLIAFGAGVFSGLTGSAAPMSTYYGSMVSLVMLAAVLYLVYRAVRRGVRRRGDSKAT